jgi:multimeric flavodoxin WrbA
MTLRLAIIDGSLRPGVGNTARAIALASTAFSGAVSLDRIELAAYGGTIREMAGRLRAANGFLFGSGTYWNSWGSPLQRFLEVMTAYEATDVFVGKPASVVVTMDATGGVEVASRLLAALVCFGCTAPPFAYLTLSRVASALATKDPSATRDVWGTDDLAVIAHNLEAAASRARSLPPGAWKAWTIERAEPPDIEAPWPQSGPLPAAAADFA